MSEIERRTWYPYFVEDEDLEMDVCPICEGEGVIFCPVCNGCGLGRGGVGRCPVCLGRGEVRCDCRDDGQPAA